MQHQEMVQPTHFGVIGRTCLLALGVVAGFLLFM